MSFMKYLCPCLKHGEMEENMKQIKTMSIFGTRPEAIKMAPLVKELEKNPHIESMVCVTAQHREMLDQVLDIFNITPDYDLDIMRNGQTLSEITTRALTKLEKVINTEKPDIVLVHGDTTTTFVSALAAYYTQTKIGHIEAGLRTYNKYSPYPEEMNRQMVGVLSDLNFAPTTKSAENLLKEGKNPDSIFVTGNTAIDAMKYTINPNYHNNVLDWANNRKIILLTAHRRENLGEPMVRIFQAINKLVNKYDDICVIYPVHLNPKINQIAKSIFKDESQVKLIEPLNVVDFHNLQKQSYFIMTDSGGVQEEAPSLGKPVLVLRDTTERPEGIEAGTLKLVGTEEDVIYNYACQLIDDIELYNEMANASNPYGDGNASKRIVEAIVKHFAMDLL